MSVPVTTSPPTTHTSPTRTLPRRPRCARPLALSALVAAALLLLGSGAARALLVYGAPRPLPGAGGCLSDPSQEPAGEQACPGAAVGLEGAQAVAASPDGADVYVAGEGGVVALARDRADGALRPAVSPSPRACVGAATSRYCSTSDPALSGADALAVSPDGRFVYVGAADAATVSVFARGRRGTLRPLAGRLGGPGSDPFSGCVSGLPLAGVPEPRCGARLRALRGVSALAISPDGRYLYAVSYGLEPGTDSVVTLQRDPRSGGLRALPGFRGCLQSLPRRGGCRSLAGLEGASAITISPDGRFVYVASELSGAVRGFRRNPATGVLEPLFGPGGCISSGNPADWDVQCTVKVPQLAGARSIALSPDGRELYVAAFDPGAVVVLRRDPASGRLAVTPPSCLQAAPDPSCPAGLPFLRGAAAIAVASDGLAVYVAGEAADSLVELGRDPADGALAPASESPTATAGPGGPAALALSPGGESIYVASPFDNGLVALAGGA